MNELDLYNNNWKCLSSCTQAAGLLVSGRFVCQSLVCVGAMSCSRDAPGEHTAGAFDGGKVVFVEVLFGVSDSSLPSNLTRRGVLPEAGRLRAEDGVSCAAASRLKPNLRPGH